MNLAQIEETLAKWNVTVPDLNRASLYFGQIKTVRDFLFEILASDPVIGNENYQRYRTALQDPGLIGKFCEIIDGFLGGSVSSALLNPVIKYTNYDSYFINNIFEANNGDYIGNIENFFRTYPVTRRAVHVLTDNFKKNIVTVCQRIQKDWDDLLACFSTERDTVDTLLIRIAPTGSDSHKGGQQVLILTFQSSKSIGEVCVGKSWNIVYKPSDMEVDCLLIGNSDAVNFVHPGFQTASLFEIINRLIVEKFPNEITRRSLPTYVILPYNWGSGWNGKGGINNELISAYGYIEFIDHGDMSTLYAFGNYPFGMGDFKIQPEHDLAKIVNQFYRLIGELIAVATSFSLVDLHKENLIVSKYIPFLIDLENSLTTSVTGLPSTSLTGTDGGITGCFKHGESGYTIGGNAGELFLVGIYYQNVCKNRLWTVNPARPVEPSDFEAVQAIISGFGDGFEIIRQGVIADGGNKFDAWFDRLENVVVRYVPYKSGDFEAYLSEIYNRDFTNQEDFYIQKILEVARTKYDEYISENPRGLPNFVVLQNEIIGHDFLNCDVPVFYHRIGTLDIMNSRGDLIIIQSEFQLININPPPNVITIDAKILVGRDTFFDLSPTVNNVQIKQVNSLRNDKDFVARFATIYNSILDGLKLLDVPEPPDPIIYKK